MTVFGIWASEENERFPTAVDVVVYLIGRCMRCQSITKYRRIHRWKLWPRLSRVRCVEPEMTWRELVVGRYGFSWIRLNANGGQQ